MDDFLVVRTFSVVIFIYNITRRINIGYKLLWCENTNKANVHKLELF